MAAFKIGNFWGAEESFRWACQFDPENGKYFHYRGIALSRIPRRSHDAEEELRKAIELDPEAVEAAGGTATSPQEAGTRAGCSKNIQGREKTLKPR
jgi:Flp pilus assembly protein TadD